MHTAVDFDTVCREEEYGEMEGVRGGWLDERVSAGNNTNISRMAEFEELTLSMRLFECCSCFCCHIQVNIMNCVLWAAAVGANRGLESKSVFNQRPFNMPPMRPPLPDIKQLSNYATWNLSARHCCIVPVPAAAVASRGDFYKMPINKRN